uniref:Uncharacterized protein n=1 Tax=Daphnia magna TaxID=35525 RepID=A0A0P6GN27_9CRUS
MPFTCYSSLYTLHNVLKSHHEMSRHKEYTFTSRLHLVGITGGTRPIDKE